jgi:inner membrane protein
MMRKSKLAIQVLWVGLITVILTIMASMIFPLIRERSNRGEAVLREMTRIWGQPHVIAGPMVYGSDGAINLVARAVTGEIKTSTRRKGIYHFPYYNANLVFTGKVADAEAGKIMFRSRSRLVISDAKLGSTRLSFHETHEGVNYAYVAKIPAGATGVLTIPVSCEGLQSLKFVATGKTMEVSLKSDWKDPGFTGDFLPADYNISKQGFDATWKIQQGGYVAPAAKSFDLPSEDPNEEGRLISAFGVNFYQPVSIYQLTERCVKYAILFITLTFLTLILFETISSAEIHPMQYLLAGSALVIFYLLLLAFAEYLGFAVAYWIAACANIVLLAKYSGSFLLSRTHTAVFTAVLTLLYSILYVILQLEEFALISGAVMLFLALATTMYLTRKLDWYRIGEKTA